MKTKDLVYVGAIALIGFFLLRKKPLINSKQNQLPNGGISSADNIPNVATNSGTTISGTTTSGTTTSGSNILPNPLDVVNAQKAEQARLAEIARLKAVEDARLAEQARLAEIARLKAVEDARLAEIAKLKLIEDTRLLEEAKLKARELQEQQYRTQQEANQLRYYQEIARAKEIEMAELKATEDARLRGAEQERLKQIEDARVAQILIANAIQKLRDEIVANINRRNSFKTQGSKNNVQAEINAQLNKLKEYGYSLDSSNNLIKVDSGYSVTNSEIYQNFLIGQTLINNAIQKLRDEIVANINRRNGFKTQSSKNNVQADINVQLNRLKEYGYTLDNSNNLIEVPSDYSITSSDINRNFMIAQALTNSEVQKLRDEIIANINRRNGYKTQGSKNNVQADINVQLNRLKEYGYTLDNSNNLIEVPSDYSITSSDINRNFMIAQALIDSEVQKLRNEIIANINRRNGYKTQDSKNAVQADINNQLNRLKEYGYTLDSLNNLIEVVNETINNDVNTPRGGSIIIDPILDFPIYYGSPIETPLPQRPIETPRPQRPIIFDQEQPISYPIDYRSPVEPIRGYPIYEKIQPMESFSSIKQPFYLDELLPL